MARALKTDRAQARRLLPAVVNALYPVLGVAIVEGDELVIDGKRVLWHVRFGYYPRCKGDFTIRSGRAHATSELARVLAGHGDYYFYAHGSADGLIAWFLLDLAVFRREQAAVGHDARINDDARTAFRIYQMDRFTDELIVAKHEPPPAAAPVTEPAPELDQNIADVIAILDALGNGDEPDTAA